MCNRNKKYIPQVSANINRSMWVAIFPQKATTTVCLGFFINPSSMIQTTELKMTEGKTV